MGQSKQLSKGWPNSGFVFYWPQCFQSDFTSCDETLKAYTHQRHQRGRTWQDILPLPSRRFPHLPQERSYIKAYRVQELSSHATLPPKFLLAPPQVPYFWNYGGATGYTYYLWVITSRRNNFFSRFVSVSPVELYLKSYWKCLYACKLNFHNEDLC